MIVKFMYRKKSNQYACEVCQKDWNSMNDLEKHLKENHTGVQLVWMHPMRSQMIKEDIINDPEERDEESTVQEPLNVPMDRKNSNNYACEMCQKDWDSMNDLKKHLIENHPGVKGELKIKVSHGKTTIKFVKNFAETNVAEAPLHPSSVLASEDIKQNDIFAYPILD